MEEVMPAVTGMTPEWVDFLIMLATFVVVAIGAMIWVLFFRKPGKLRRKHRHHHEHLSSNPTLAENGGLPPIRPGEKPSRRPAPTPHL
jgi:hypothetical protein